MIAIGCANVAFLKRAKHIDLAGKIGRLGLESSSALDGDKIDCFGQIKVIEAVKKRLSDLEKVKRAL